MKQEDNYFTQNKDRIIKTFPYLAIFGLFYFFPLLVNDNFYFEGSTWRALGFVPDVAAQLSGRVLVEPLLSLLSLELDIFNFTKQTLIYTGITNQIISIFTLVVSSIVFYYRINSSEFNFHYGLVAFSFILNPFLLETLSYKTACIYMVLPTALALIASSLNTRNQYWNVIISIIILFSSLSLYQVSFNVFCAASILIFLIDFQQDIKKSITHLIANLIKISIATLIYKLLIINNINVGEYYKSNTVPFPLDSNLFTNIINKFIYLFQENLGVFLESKLLIIFSIISVVGFAAIYIIKNKNKLLAFLIFCTCTFLLIFFCFGFISIFKSTTSEPRLLAACSVLFVFIFHSFYTLTENFIPKFKNLLLIPTIFFVIISFSYSAMQESQFRFCNRITNSLIDRLESLGVDAKTPLLFSGSIGPSPYTRNTVEKNLILRKLYIEYLNGNWFSWLFTRHLGLETQLVTNINMEAEAHMCSNNEALYKSQYYKIMREGELYVAAFRYGDCYNKLK